MQNSTWKGLVSKYLAASLLVCLLAGLAPETAQAEKRDEIWADNPFQVIVTPLACGGSALFFRLPESSVWLSGITKCEFDRTIWEREVSWPVPGPFGTTVLMLQLREVARKVKVRLTSPWTNDTLLVKAASAVFQSMQRESAQTLVSKYLQGLDPGKGLKYLPGTDRVLYLRHFDGTRVFVRWAGEQVLQIVGIANKVNESQVIRRLQEIYPK